MTLKEIKNKLTVKQSLAEKYNRLAMIAGSSVKRRTFLFHAAHHRAQVADLERLLAQRTAG